MRRRLSSAIGPLRTIARGCLRRKLARGARASAARSRRCRLEALEQRALLSVGPAADRTASDAWTPTVDAAWFEQIASASEAAPQMGPLALETETSAQKSGAADDSVTASSRQWVVQLTEEATGLAGDVAGAADLLVSSSFQTQILGGLGLEGMVLLEADADVDAGTVEAWLAGHPQVAYAEPNAPIGTEAIPNDDDFSELWGLNNTGQTGGTADADIDAPEAWDLATGSSSIVVGVIDTGIDYTHPDLAANVWTNPGEIAGNGTDDDGNGFVDDVHGYDFANGDGDPMDDNGHGTHVSGTIAAVGDNGQGITGVNWTGSLMALKFLDGEGNGFTSAAVQALNYATMMRTQYGVEVRVTNNSWGGAQYSQALRNAIQASGDAGMLFVAAAGNDAADTDAEAHYPSGYGLSNIVAVTASDDGDALASFSNYGATSIDLAAPGVDVYSTLPGGEYGTYSGTSMSVPHVSGVAALAWSVVPNGTVAQVRTAILEGIDSLDSLSGRVASGGRLNALGTLERLSLSVAASTPEAGSVVAEAPVEFTVQLSHAYDPLSLDAADLAVNGTPANHATAVDAFTVLFQFDTTPAATEGPQGMEIEEGAILREGDADPIEAWQATFYFDALPLAVVSTSPSQGAVQSAAPTTIVLDFNEPVDPESVDVDDLALRVGSVTAAAMLDDDSIAYTTTGLPRDGEVTYTLSEGAIRDAYGTPGPAYVGSFTIDDPTIERYEAADVPQTITDHGTVVSKLTIDESFAIADLDVEIEIAHTYDADLEVYLVAPDGTRITLLDGVGGADDDFTGTILDDEADTAIGDGEAPFTGRYRPAQSLSTLDGLDVLGTWTLEVTDRGSRDVGVLYRWSLVAERGAALPPRIVSIDPLPGDGGDAWGTVDTLDVRFSREMNADRVNEAGFWELVAAGADELFDTADDVAYTLTVSPAYVSGTTATVEIGGGALPVGRYRLTVTSGGLISQSGTPLDGDGDGTGGDDYVTHFQVLPADWYPSDDVPQPITDRSTVTSTLIVTESFPIADLDVKIDVTHSYDADLDVYLIAPDGTRIELFTDVGGSGDDFTTTVLDDEADTAITDGESPFAGRFRPEEALSLLDGLDAQGTWTLEVTDDNTLDPGTLNAWGIIVEREGLAPPQIVSVDPLPSDGGQILGPVDHLEVVFSKRMDAATVNDADHWELTGAGADGTFDTDDDVLYPLTVTPAYTPGLAATLELSVERLPSGNYRFTALGGGLKDRFGMPLDGDADGVGGDDYVTHFTVLPGTQYPSGDVPRDLADLGTITSTVTIDESFLIADLNVQITITHPYDNDMDVYLFAPDGRRIELFTDVGGSGNDFRGVVLDDEAAIPIAEGAAPFAGQYQPEGRLAVVDGSNARGTWTLEVTDDAAMDQGVLESWTLILEPAASTDPPHVVGHAPDGIAAGPVEIVQVEFDQPMDETSFSPADDLVSFVGPEGSISLTGYDWLDSRTLEIQFAPQQAGGTYTLVLGPQILDASGTPLDQDGDLSSGETPDDQYTVTFTLAQALGAVAFLEIDGLDPAAGEIWYQLQTTRAGGLTVEANFQVGLGNVELALYADGASGSPVVVAIPTYGNRRIDRDVDAAGEVYFLRVSGDHSEVDLRLANVLGRDGTGVTVFGTDGDDRFEFDTSTAHQVTINGLRYEFETDEVSTVAFYGGPGDEAIISGSDSEAVLEMWPNRSTLVGPGYTVVVEGAERITGHGGAAAYLHDSAQSDTFIATPQSAKLKFGGLEDDFVEAVGFGEVHAFASDDGQTDTAILEDQPGQQNRFRAWSTEAKMYGLGFYNRVKGFDDVQARGSDDSDVAELYDSSGPDVLDAYADRTTLTRSDGTVVQAEDFRWLFAFASNDGETDTARLYDTTADRGTSYPTWFKGYHHLSKMYGATFYNRVDDFDEVIACAAGSDDTTKLFDSSGPDVFAAYADQATMRYPDGTTVEADDFRWMLAYGSSDGQVDTARFYDTTADLGASYATWFKAENDISRMYREPVFYVQARQFDQVSATAVGGDDTAKLFDSALDDVYWSRPNQSRMEYADGAYAEAVDFRYVLSYSRDGTDTATFYDQTLSGTSYAARLVASADWAKLFHGAFYSRTEGFTTVRAALGGDDDLAWLHDDPTRVDHLLAPFPGDAGHAAAKAKLWTDRRAIYLDDFHTLTATTSENSVDEKDVDSAYVDDVILEGNWADSP